MNAHTNIAKKAWHVLQSQITMLGWKDRATRLVLFEPYVCSALLYGCAVWGSHKLDRHGRFEIDATGPFGTFYRSSLRSLMGVDRDMRNDILYVFTTKPPLQVFIMNAII